MSVNPYTDPAGAAAFKAEQKAIRANRRAAAPDTGFVRTMKSVMTQYLKARADGVSREDGIRGIAEELRAAWPKSVSKFDVDCQACDDTGYVEMTCWDQQRCGRKWCAGNAESEHRYVVPCHCAKGERKVKRERVFTPEDAIAAQARTKKKRGFTRIGA